MDQSAHFAVDTRLTRILGETYRSSEAALKELVDNAWDADGTNVWITLPEPLTNDAIIIRDDGAGMTAFDGLDATLVASRLPIVSVAVTAAVLTPEFVPMSSVLSAPLMSR